MNNMTEYQTWIHEALTERGNTHNTYYTDNAQITKWVNDTTATPDMSAVPEFHLVPVLKALDIEQGLFVAKDVPVGVLGYSNNRTIHLPNGIELYLKVAWHEMAHILLGHTAHPLSFLEDMIGWEGAKREMDAEMVSLLLCHLYNYTAGYDVCRDYIQNWATNLPPEEFDDNKRQQAVIAVAQLIYDTNKKVTNV